MQFSNLPDILEAKDLIAFLPVGKNAIYELLKTQTIPNIQITARRRIITKAAFGKYLGLDAELVGTPRPVKEAT